MLSLKEAEAKAAMEQLLLEAGLEDEGEESQEIKSSKKKNKKYQANPIILYMYSGGEMLSMCIECDWLGV